MAQETSVPFFLGERLSCKEYRKQRLLFFPPQMHAPPQRGLGSIGHQVRERLCSSWPVSTKVMIHRSLWKLRLSNNLWMEERPTPWPWLQGGNSSDNREPPFQVPSCQSRQGSVCQPFSYCVPLEGHLCGKAMEFGPASH